MFDINGEIAAARAAYRMRQFRAVVSSCRVILSQDSAHREAHELLALAELGDGNPDAAAAHLLELAERQPQDAELQLFTAAALQRCNRQTEAIGILENLLRRRPQDARAQFQLAAALQAAGRIDEAIGRYRKLLRSAPQAAEIHNNLGMALSQTGDRDAALRSFHRALEIDPDYVRALNNLGKTLQELRRAAEAIAPLERAVALAPESPEGLTNLGAAYKATGKFDQAISTYHRAIRVRPDLAQAHFNLGNALIDAGRAGEALDPMSTAVRLMPQFGGARQGLAAAHFALQRYSDAAAALGEAVRLDPGNLELRLQQARAQAHDHQFAGAVHTLRGVLALSPHHPEARWQLAVALRNSGDFFESIALFEQLVQENSQAPAGLHFDYGQALAAAGAMLGSRGHLERSSAQFQAAVERDPSFALARMHLGLALLAAPGSKQRAREELERAVEIDSSLIVGWWRLAALRAEGADWADYPAMLRRMHELSEVSEAGIDPLFMAFLIDDPEAQLRCARAAARAFGSAGEAPARSRPRLAKGQLRIAYLSPDFRAHPVGMSIVELLQRHDRSRIETIVIAFGPADDGEYRRRIQAGCGRYFDVSEMSNAETVLLLRELDIDIAVDLAGHTLDSRPLILAQRPAPINAQFLGYPGSMGVPWMDYIIADPFVIPREQFGNYSESVAWLPECFFPSDTTQSIAAGAPQRHEAGLPEDAVVFCCFNQFVRIGPEQLDSWIRILRAVPGSVLWLRSGDADAQANVRREAESRGLEGQRLIFAAGVNSRADHLRRHRLADLYLDSYPYNGHSTARDALWAGLPILTRPGQGFASRVAGSLVNAVGMHDLIAQDVDAYESTAIALGLNRPRLAELKQRLSRATAASPLFDTPRLAAHLEDCYELMYARWTKGEHPSPLAVPARPNHA
jgi:protein O-GlcNAc transferase